MKRNDIGAISPRIVINLIAAVVLLEADHRLEGHFRYLSLTLIVVLWGICTLLFDSIVSDKAIAFEDIERLFLEVTFVVVLLLVLDYLF